MKTEPEHITKGSVFDDLFSPEEAANLKIRSALMSEVEQFIKDNKLTQTKAAKVLGIDQSYVSKLMSGDINLFTIDKLVNMLARINKGVKCKVVELKKAA